MSASIAINPLTNQSVWIPFFIRFHRLPLQLQPYYSVFVACEVIGHIFSLITCFFGLFVFFRAKAFHFNLAHAIMNGFYVGPPFILLRIPLILMETGIIKYETMADNVIVLISLARMFLFVALYNFEVNIAIERYFALRYVRTYEKVRRRYIAAIILSANALYSVIVSYLLTYNYLHGFIYVALVCIANNLAFLLFLYTAKKNEQVQATLTQFRKSDRSYTVSYRWQLHDNSRSARELRTLMIGCNGIISFILPVLFVPALIMDNNPAMSGILEAAKLVYQVNSAFVFGGSYVFVTLIIKKHRDFLFGTSHAGRVSPAFYPAQTCDRVTAETDNHFRRLHKEWGVGGVRIRTDAVTHSVT